MDKKRIREKFVDFVKDGIVALGTAEMYMNSGSLMDRYREYK